MTPVEKWSSVSGVTDLAIALLLLAVGLGLVASHRRIAAALVARTARGELSEADAHRQARLIHRCSYGVAACGAALLVAWALGA